VRNAGCASRSFPNLVHAAARWRGFVIATGYWTAGALNRSLRPMLPTPGE